MNQKAPSAEAACLGCALVELDSVRHPGGQWLCPTCPALPEDKRRPVDTLRAGVGALLARGRHA